MPQHANPQGDQPGRAPLRVGGVGTGRIFQWAHLRAYPDLLEKARLTAFYDPDRDRAEAACEKYREALQIHASAAPAHAEAARDNIGELRVCGSLDELLDHVDIVDVCTTARGRMPTVIAAAERGVHSMVEKPMARTWIEADRGARVIADTPGVHCQLNDDNIFDPKYRVLHDLLADGAIGSVDNVSLIRGSRLDATSVLKSQASAVENGGGCLMDYGSPGLAGVWHMLGTHLRVARVEAVRIGVRHRHRLLEGDPFVMEVDDDAHVRFLFEDPATGAWTTVFMESTWCGGEIGLHESKGGGQGDGYLRIAGENGVIDATGSGEIRILKWDGGETRVPLREYPGETISVREEIETCVDCVAQDIPPEFDIEFGADIIAAIGAAYLSAVEHRAVTLDEFKEFSRGYVREHGDGEDAENAILDALLAPYRLSKTASRSG